MSTEIYPAIARSGAMNHRCMPIASSATSGPPPTAERHPGCAIPSPAIAALSTIPPSHSETLGTIPETQGHHPLRHHPGH
jgi:hypothetical protein